MTVADLSIDPAPVSTIDADVLVLGVLKTDAGPEVLTDDPRLAISRETLLAIGATGASEQLRRIPGLGAAPGIALIGLGSGPIGATELRLAAGAAARQLNGVDTVAVALPAQSSADVEAILEGAAIGAYRYLAYRAPDPTRLPPAHIIAATTVSAPDAVQRARIAAEAVHTVRDLVNQSPAELYPQTLADAAVALCAGLPITSEVLAEPELLKGGFGGLLGVGQGSTRGPRLVTLRYEPAGATRHLALVGKGITFDSGGLSLKPPASMIGMKYDMTGAATALAVIVAAARLALPVRLTAWLCLAENLPSGSAMRPGDVITVRGGTTVEVLNTDAEGRLVLADGLSAAREEEPDAIIDIATLTGAASIAMGNRTVAVMGSDALVKEVVDCGSAVGESLWPMPIPAEVRALLASDIADIANVKPGNTAGGMLIAAAFLRDFVGTIPWAHLDIASAANNGGSGWGFNPKGPTGVAVRALVRLAEDFSLPV
jgi:leucyl aminopeptidase